MQAEIQVWFYPFAPQYTLYRFDDRAVVALYSHRSARGGVVTLLVKGGILASYLQDEFNNLVNDDSAGIVTEAALPIPHA